MTESKLIMDPLKESVRLMSAKMWISAPTPHRLPRQRGL